jgi:hypothetical protein
MLLALALIASAQPAAAPAAADGLDVLAGAWTVDLRLKRSDAPYNQPMTLALAEDGSVQGTFYGSPIEAGRWKSDRGRTCVSFRTRDGAGPYHHSACAGGREVQGQTWAEGRNFLFNWIATRP